MATYREQGIVLRTIKLGETDRILTLLTPGRGKVRAVAKGVRRPGSRFGGRLEPYGLVDLQLYEGRRGLDTVNQAELIAPHAAVRADWERSACAATIAEAADTLAQPGERAVSLFLLVRDGLRALEAGPDRPAAVLDAVLLRLASVAGYHAALDVCATCGQPGPHEVFHLDRGGLLCPVCAPVGSQPLAAGVLDGLQALRTHDLGGAPVPEEAVGRLVATLVASYLAHHLGRPLTAWESVPR